MDFYFAVGADTAPVRHHWLHALSEQVRAHLGVAGKRGPGANCGQARIEHLRHTGYFL